MVESSEAPAPAPRPVRRWPAEWETHRATWLACRDALSVLQSDYARPTLNYRKRQENVMHFVRDLRHAGRALVRTPAFSLVVLATLALAIGASMYDQFMVVL